MGNHATGVAVVTGASSGIGKATALRLASHGFDIGITYAHNKAGALSAAAGVEERGRKAEVRQLDLSRSLDHAEAVVGDLTETLGGLDAFVNNAGTQRLSPFLEETLEDWRRMLEVNLTGAFVCAQAAARLMVAHGGGGRIVNVTSIHDHLPLREAAAYCASKGGMSMLTKVMALELASHGITVNSVAPGETATPMSGADENTDVASRPRPNIPLGRPASPEEPAGLIAYLVSPEAAYTTGATFLVDGGMGLWAAIPNQDMIMAALKPAAAKREKEETWDG